MSTTVRVRPLLKLAAALLALCGISIAQGSAPAGAHPLGNATVNRYAGMVVAPDGVLVDYVLDLAEIPTVQVRDDIDQAGGTKPYGTQRCGELVDGLRLTLDGFSAPLQSISSRAVLVAGQGGLPTLRLECQIRTAPNVEVGGGALTFQDTNEPGRAGWREFTLTGRGMAIQSDLPTSSVSRRLTDYPSGEDAPLPQARTAQASLKVIDPNVSLSPVLNGSQSAAPLENGPARTDRLADLIGRADQGRWAVLAALAVAAGLGGLHGLAPGHGKAVVAAYLVGTRGSRRQAAGLAGIIALSHTSGVFVLGGLTLVASATFPVERVHAWLRLASALLVLGLGLWLITRLLAARGGAHNHQGDQPPHGRLREHGHSHDHGLVGGLHHRQDHHFGHDHQFPQAQAVEHALQPGWRSAGYHADLVVASAAAVAHRQLGAENDHQHDHNHDQAGSHQDIRTPKHTPAGHRHGLLPHRHTVAWNQLDTTRPLRWRSLLLLGIAGGLVPSASAVIVLLGAVQVGETAFGAALIVAFGTGLAAALVGVGMGVVTFTRRGLSILDQRIWVGRVQRNLAPLACVALLMVGVWLTYRAVSTF